MHSAKLETAARTMAAIVMPSSWTHLRLSAQSSEVAASSLGSRSATSVSSTRAFKSRIASADQKWYAAAASMLHMYGALALIYAVLCPSRLAIAGIEDCVSQSDMCGKGSASSAVQGMNIRICLKGKH
eukprot:16089-Heterococcus_DN1.PRE.6